MGVVDGGACDPLGGAGCDRGSRDFDAADDWVASQVEPGDLVVTADVPLPARAVERSGMALDPRGEVIDATNAASRLRERDLMETHPRERRVDRWTGAVQ